MKTTVILGAVTFVIGSWLTGCSNTAQGIQEDAAQNAPHVKQAMDRAGQQLAQSTADAKVNLDKAGQQLAQATVGIDKKLSTEGAQVGQEVKGSTKSLGAALILTPRIKSAIVADKELNDSHNRIDVDSTANVVHLRGHVYTNEMKQRATQIAQKVLNEEKASDKLSNELQVPQG